MIRIVNLCHGAAEVPYRCRSTSCASCEWAITTPTFCPATTVVYTIQVEPQVATTFLYNVNFAASDCPREQPPRSIRTPGGRRKITNIQDDGENRTTALSTPPASPFNRVPLALGLLLPLIGVRSVRRQCGNFPFSWVWRCCSAEPDGGRRADGCSGAGFSRSEKFHTITVTATEGTLQALNHGASCNLLNGVPPRGAGEVV